MNTSDFRFGFRIVGPTSEPRRLVDAGAALAAYAGCDARAEVSREAYLSAFRFGEDFHRLLLETGSTAGFSGPCWSPWLWFDIDAEDLHAAYKDAGALVAALVERYAVPPGELLIFFSGSKGFHVGLPTALWSPAPSADFHKTARRFAEHVAELAAVTIDTGVYDRVRAFRAPNSRHPKTGLHKRRLTADELTGLSLERIAELAREPAPFDVPPPTVTSNQAAADWAQAVQQVAQESEAKAARRAVGNGSPPLNRSTLDFIREGAGTGDRHRLLFSAAANLAEFGCTPALAVALLEESALDSGLPPKEVRRQIECGLAAIGSASTRQDGAGSAQSSPDGSAIQEPAEAAASDSAGSQGQSCQQGTGAPPPADGPAAGDLQVALARLWGRSPDRVAAGAPDRVAAGAQDAEAGRAGLPADPLRLIPLPAGAVGTGKLDVPCKCGSTEYVEVPITGGRTRRDCRECGRFIGWGRWHTEGGER